MGTDNLAKKRRKAKSQKDLTREKAKRNGYEKILIICEGEKTEPLYLQKFIDRLKLSSSKVKIAPHVGSAPISIVSYAKDMFNQAKQDRDPFDKIFCVFDRDSHADFDRAVNMINSFTPKNKLINIISYPCFEYWLLLGYVYTTKLFTKSRKDSPCDMVIKNLKKYIPNYEKGDENLISSLLDNLEISRKNSINIYKNAIATNTFNPSTTIHELIGYLENLKK